MKRIAFTFVFLLSTPSFAIDAKIKKALQNAIDKQTSQNVSVGISVGIIDLEDRASFHSGMKDLASNTPLIGDEYFAIGSVSKTFTSLLLSKAVTEGKIDIDDKVESILSEFEGSQIGSITLRQLSSHSSGLQRDPKKLSGDNILLPFENYSRTDLIKELKEAKFTTSAGNFQYSNLGIALLGICLEEIFQADFESLMHKEIFSPLKLSEIFVTMTEAQIPIMPSKYSSDFTQLPIWKDLGFFNSVGSFKATTETMLDYLYAQLNPSSTLLKEAIENSQNEIQAFPNMSLAYGWIVRDLAGKKVYWHNGSTAGFLTDVYFIPAEKKAMVVFNNSDTSTDCVVNIFFLGDTNCSSQDIGLDTDEFMLKASGFYLNKEFKMLLQVTKTDYGFLKIQVVGQAQSVRLFKVSENNYVFLNGQGKLSFDYNENNEIMGLTFIQNGNTIKTMKVDI